MLTFKLAADRQHLQLISHDTKGELKDLQLYFKKRQKGYHFNRLYQRKLWDGYDKFIDKDWNVCKMVRAPNAEIPSAIAWDVLAGNNIPNGLKVQSPFDAICWAQGANLNDSIYSFNKTNHQALYEANVLFVLESLSQLLKAGLLAKSAKLCIVSSIWQEISRQNKLSY